MYQLHPLQWPSWELEPNNGFDLGLNKLGGTWCSKQFETQTIKLDLRVKRVTHKIQLIERTRTNKSNRNRYLEYPSWFKKEVMFLNKFQWNCGYREENKKIRQ